MNLDDQTDAHQNPSLVGSVSYREEQFSGPLPSPNILADYDSVVPGTAKLMVEIMQNQAKRRMELERSLTRFWIFQVVLSQVMAFILAMTGILGGIYLTANDQSVVGLVAITASIGSLVGVFLWERQRGHPSSNRQDYLVPRQPPEDEAPIQDE